MRKEKLPIIILFLLCFFILFANFDSKIEAKEPVLPDGIYYLKNYSSQKYMDVYEQSPNSGSNVHQMNILYYLKIITGGSYEKRLLRYF